MRAPERLAASIGPNRGVFDREGGPIFDPFSVRKYRGTAARYAAPTGAKCTRGVLGMLPERPRASAASASAAARPQKMTKNDKISPKNDQISQVFQGRAPLGQGGQCLGL